MYNTNKIPGYKMKDKLISYNRKIITIEELTKFSGHIEYINFVELINKYVSENILEPVKASGKNGRSPALFNKYRIIKKEYNYDNDLENIKKLYPSFNISKYGKHPEIYNKYKNEIDMLSNFLWKNEELLKSSMSINERSFQIWGQEKLLKDKSTINSIFNYNDMDLSILNYYETPEPFFEYIFSNEDTMNILIIENKDTWFSLRKIMREEKLNFLYRNYNILLYGEGKKIISRNDRFKEYDILLSKSKNSYYYFGDLDYEGIEIYQSLKINNKEININLCTELYSLMLAESLKYNLPNTKLGQKKVDISLFLGNFKEQEKSHILEILNSGLYIPQEILNYQLLLKVILKGDTHA